MREPCPNYAAIENEIVKLQLTTGLQEAIDRRFRTIFETAKAEWERRFCGPDPSDACVTVRITSLKEERRGVRGSGFLRGSGVSEVNGKHYHLPA